MDEHYVVEPSTPSYLRVAFRAYWIVTPAIVAYFWLRDDPDDGLLAVLGGSAFVTVVGALLAGYQMPRRYLIDKDGILIFFGWPRSHRFFFKDGLEIEAGVTASGFWTLDAAFDRKGPVTVRRERSAWWQWRSAVLSVAEPGQFIAAANRASERYRTTGRFMEGF
jgi:hypothetical protein